MDFNIGIIINVRYWRNLREACILWTYIYGKVICKIFQVFCQMYVLFASYLRQNAIYSFQKILIGLLVR